MKHDPGMHIGMHLVCFSKTGCDKDEAVTKDGIEVSDDNVMKDWNHGLMIRRRS
jgi:hypothetical protein